LSAAGFENVAAVRIGLEHATDMMAKVAFGDELREDIVGGWRSTKASTRRSGETMKP
jgi:hypothetical protein